MEASKAFAKELVDRMPHVLVGVAMARGMTTREFLVAWGESAVWASPREPRPFSTWQAQQLFREARQSSWFRALFISAGVDARLVATNAEHMRRLRDVLLAVAEHVA
jgi:hypothetical protein